MTRVSGRPPVEPHQRLEVSPLERPSSDGVEGFELLMRLGGLVLGSGLGLGQRELLNRLLVEIGLEMRSRELLARDGVVSASTRADCWRRMEELYRSLLATVRTP